MIPVDRESELPQLASRGWEVNALWGQSCRDSECLLDWPVTSVDLDRVLEHAIGFVPAQPCADITW